MKILQQHLSYYNIKLFDNKFDLNDVQLVALGNSENDFQNTVLFENSDNIEN